MIVRSFSGRAKIDMSINGQLVAENLDTGTKNGAEYSFHIKSRDLPTYGMCTDLSRFYTFVDGEFVEFYPKHRVVEKFFLATEEIHRVNGGAWQDFKFEKDAAAKA